MNINQLNEMPNAKSGTWDFRHFKDKPEIINHDVLDSFKQVFTKSHKNELYYFIWNNFDAWYLAHEIDAGKYAVIGYLKVADYPRLPNAWQVDGIDIHKDNRNQGLSTFMYNAIQVKTNKILVSDNSQYEGARKIWMSLAKTVGVKVYDEITGEKSGYITIDDFDDHNIWGPKHSKKLLLIENRNLLGE